MASTLVRPSNAPSAAVDLDAAQHRLPPITETMRALVACRSRDLLVPADLLNSVRAWRLASLADAIERYNDRLDLGRVTAAGA